jgi:MFS family permease
VVELHVTSLNGDACMGNRTAGTTDASPVRPVTRDKRVDEELVMRRQVVHYAGAAVLVRTADEGARVALVLLALERTRSAALGGLLVAALLVPHVAAAGVVGARADRSRRPLRVVAVAAAGFGIALGLTSAALGPVPAPVVLGVLLAGGCCGPALTGALSSHLPALVPAREVPRAFGVDALTYDVAGMLGPAVAGVVAGRASAAVATVVLAVAALAGAAAVAALPAPPDRERPEPGSVKLTDGVRAMWRERPLAVVTAATSLGQLGFGALPVVVAVVAVRHAAPSTAGLLLAALTAGGLVGSLIWTWRPAAPEHAPWVVVAALLGTALPVAAGALTTSPAVLAALFALSGVANGPLIGALLVTRERFAPSAVRSQVFTLGAGVKTSFTAAGSALAGLLAAWPTATQLLLVAACPIVAALGGAAGLRLRLRDRTTENYSPTATSTASTAGPLS